MPYGVRLAAWGRAQTGPLAAGGVAAPAATPEPATLALAALGGLGLLGLRRKRARG